MNQEHPDVSEHRPAGIDNSDLIYDDAAAEDTVDIHDTLLEGRDYVLLPQQVWNQLHSWYLGFSLLVSFFSDCLFACCLTSPLDC